MIDALRTFPLMLEWTWRSSRPWLSLLFALNILAPVALIIGVSFFFADITPAIARNLITGTPAFILLDMGMNFVPQMVASARLQGTHDFMLALPVPRTVLLASDVTIFFLLTIPGVIFALVLGSVYHDFTLTVSPLVIPSFIMISLTGSFVGYAIALAVPRPQMANIASQVLLFFIVFFSPVIYPVEQLPGWLTAVHNVLPIRYMADLSRGSLTDTNIDKGLAFAVTGAWCVISFLFCWIAMKRRS